MYKHPVTVKAEYDPKVKIKLKSFPSSQLIKCTSSPQGMLVKILEDSEQKEFVVCQGSEFARVGRKGIIFKVKNLILVFRLLPPIHTISFLSVC